MDLLGDGVDDMKWTMRIMAKIAQKELGKLMKNEKFIERIHNDLRMSTNPVIRKIYRQIVEAGQAMPTDYHSSTICDLGAFALWVMYKDTAYRDPFFWLLDNLVNDKDIRAKLKPFVKQPADWYCPQWIKSKDRTAQLKKDGVIGELDMSQEEGRFVPELQFKEINNMVQSEIERQRQRRL
jgi:hypothetical protein